jgi:hypothetical protein
VPGTSGGSTPPTPDGATGASGAPAPTKVNNAPTISGTPPTRVTAGQVYSFTPTVKDLDGDKLAFYIQGKPAWSTFDAATGRLSGTPRSSDAGPYGGVSIRVSDGRATASLPTFAIDVALWRKANYGHYFATNYGDTPADAAMLCGQPGVKGIVWRRTWGEIETSPGVYDFGPFDEVLQAMASSANPKCQLWVFVEWKSFNSSPYKNPCPAYLQANYSAANFDGNGAATCFMWEPAVVQAYTAMMKAAAARYNGNPRVEGMILQESSLGFRGGYSQNVADGGTYTPEAWRDALSELVTQCGAAFSNSRCVAFLNFLEGRQAYLADVARAVAAVPNNRGCFSGPDLLPDNKSLYSGQYSAYEMLTRQPGCRSNSAQNDSYEVTGCDMDCIFKFAVRGTYGDFNETAPRTSGVCVNSYLFWNHRNWRSSTGLDWRNTLPVIAANPYGPGWYGQCAGGGAAP